MSAEETALRFLRAAAAQFHKNGAFAPLLWNSAIAAMRISTGAPQRSRGRRKACGYPRLTGQAPVFWAEVTDSFVFRLAGR